MAVQRDRPWTKRESSCEPRNSATIFLRIAFLINALIVGVRAPIYFKERDFPKSGCFCGNTIWMGIFILTFLIKRALQSGPNQFFIGEPQFKLAGWKSTTARYLEEQLCSKCCKWFPSDDTTQYIKSCEDPEEKGQKNPPLCTMVQRGGGKKLRRISHHIIFPCQSGVIDRWQRNTLWHDIKTKKGVSSLMEGSAFLYSYLTSLTSEVSDLS